MKPHLGTRLRAGLALLALSSVSCGSPAPPGPPPYAVIHRVDEARGRHAEPLKLRTESRNALGLPAGDAFDVSLPAPARGIVFSTAARTPRAVRFTIRARAGGEWREIFSVTRSPGPPAWLDHRVGAELIPPGATRFRFETAAVDQTAGEAMPYWGSIRFLGGRPALRDAPNVVLVSLDTLSAAHLSSFDNVPGVSPHIDAFLDESFSFRRAYAQYGNTLVSHASLFSGLFPRHHSLYPHSPFSTFTSLVETLAAAGYETAAVTEGAYVASNWGFGRGFDAYDDGSLGLETQMAGHAQQTFDQAAAWLAERAEQNRFFLFVHTYEVHIPYVAESEAEEAVVRRITSGELRRFPAALQAQRTLGHNNGRNPLSPEDLAYLQALQSAEILRLDGIVGRFLERIEELGLDDDTLVVLTADHGDQFGEGGKVGHGNSLHNYVLHVPLGFRWPGRIRPGHSDDPVQLVDVLPTVLELAGIPAPGALDGRSLAPLLRGEALPVRPAFSEMLSALGECQRLGLTDNCRLDRYAVQTQRFKLISSSVPRSDRLYDLAEDPLETRDVSTEHPDELARLRALLARYLSTPAGASASSGSAPLDAQTLRQLEALGYKP